MNIINTCPTCRAEDPVSQAQIQANFDRQLKQLNPPRHLTRFNIFETMTRYHEDWLGRLEKQHRNTGGLTSPVEYSDGLIRAPFTRLERLLERHEEQLRRLTVGLDRPPRQLELQSTDSEDPSAWLDSLEELLKDHGKWIDHLQYGSSVHR
jgi:hypothetical protein